MKIIQIRMPDYIDYTSSNLEALQIWADTNWNPEEHLPSELAAAYSGSQYRLVEALS